MISQLLNNRCNKRTSFGSPRLILRIAELECLQLQEGERYMPNRLSLVLLAVLAVCVIQFSCTHGEESNESLAPFLYPDSARVFPNPAWLYEDATFYFAFRDHDGDMQNPVVILRRTDEKEDEDAGGSENSQYVEVDDIAVDGAAYGSISFPLEILDGYQGNYYISVMDEAGNVSEEIEVFLFVNSEPRTDDDAL
jgi:hypothetical protein